MNFPQDLRKIYNQGRLLPFIGAGISSSVQWQVDCSERRGPSWSELVEKAAKLMGFEDAELLRFRGSDLQILEYYKQINNDNTTELTNWLVQELNPPDDALLKSPIHCKLAELEKCKTFYTTNYDNFIERAFNLQGKDCKVIAKEHHMCNALNGECEIVKFHGDLNNPDKMVLTEADYENRLTLSSELDYRFISDLLNRTVLFLGYSFRDPNVSYLFRKIDSLFSKKNSYGTPKAYIVVKYPSKFEKLLFRSRNIEIIPAETDDLTEFITKLLLFIKNQ